MTGPRSCSSSGAAAPPAPATRSPPRGRGVRRPAVGPLQAGCRFPWGLAPGLFAYDESCGAGAGLFPSRDLHRPQAPALPVSALGLPQPALQVCSSTGLTPCTTIVSAMPAADQDDHPTRKALSRYDDRQPPRTHRGDSSRGGDSSLPRDAHPDARDPRRSSWPSSDYSAEPTTRLKQTREQAAFSCTGRLSPPRRKPPGAGACPQGGLPDPLRFKGGRTRLALGGPLRETRKRRGMLAHAAPSCSERTDRVGCYSASAPPARRIASVTMPTLVTPAPLAASITSMISP